MKFTLVRSNPGMYINPFPRPKFITETLKIADWVKEHLDPNRIDELPDLLFDGSGDIVRGDDGKLYIAEKFYFNDHFDEYGIWCQIEEGSHEFPALVVRAADAVGGFSALARELGVTPQAIQGWKKGQFIPRPRLVEKMERIARG